MPQQPLRWPGSAMRQNWLSNRIFKSFDDIVDHCCNAWNTLIDQPWKIMSIARRDWATMGYSMRGLVLGAAALRGRLAVVEVFAIERSREAP